MAESILIVEDNPTNLKLLRILLNVEGYEVREAISAYEALKLLETYQPKLILMDIQLPGMDGLELTREIKNNPKYRDIIIIAITAYAMKHDKEKVLAAGCDGYITKPIDVKTLPAVIASYLREKVVS